MRSLFAQTASRFTANPAYSPLGRDDDSTSDGLRSPHETKPHYLPSGEMGYDYASETCRPLRSSWRIRRRRPLLGRTLGATLVVATLLVGVWTYSTHTTQSNYPLPDFEAPQTETVVDLIQVADGTLILDNDPTHVLVPVPAVLPATDELLPPLDTRPPLDVLVQYYVTGDVAATVEFPQPSLDLVYLFVNASSPYFDAARAAQLNASHTRLPLNKQHHWRDNGELRGAIRSGALSLAGRISRIHVVSAAFDDPDRQYQLALNEVTGDVGTDELGTEDVETEDVAAQNIVGWQMGQIPYWLDWANKSNLNWHFHQSVFRLPRDNGRLPESIQDVNETEWQTQAVPSFNSFAIESRIPWIKTLSEEFIYSNDDMFMLRNLTHADFHHPLVGNVFRLDPGLLVKPQVDDRHRSDSGEWGGLLYASQLVSQRFPNRNRMYMHHMPKALKRSLMHEASIMFAAELTEAATRPFRETNSGVADVEMAWLATHLQIERWREALLYVWAVAKIGDLDGNWGANARDVLRDVLGLRAGMEKGTKVVINVEKTQRKTLKNLKHVSNMGAWEMPGATAILFTSFDGHMVHAPYSDEEWNLKKQREKRPHWGAKLRPAPPTTCTFDVDECLPPDFWDPNAEFSSVDMFKRFAFSADACGDCLIDALVNASGRKGLSAFLPPADKAYAPPPRAPQMWDRDEPMLPLTPTWEEADFSLANVVRPGQDQWLRAEPKESQPEGTVNLLDWSVKLLSRYAYVYATTPSRFEMVHSVIEMQNALRRLQDKSKNIALACVNDDQPDVYSSHIRVQLQKWMANVFGGASRFVEWEKEDAKWDLED